MVECPALPALSGDSGGVKEADVSVVRPHAAANDLNEPRLRRNQIKKWMEARRRKKGGRRRSLGRGRI